MRLKTAFCRDVLGLPNQEKNATSGMNRLLEGVRTDVEGAIVHIAPALDISYSRPTDTAHSEYGGITKMPHQLLVDQVFSSPTIALYCMMLRKQKV